MKEICPNASKILELGAGFGSTAAVMADAGLEVTANELTDRVDFSKRFEELDLRGSLKFIRGDFYEAELGANFDAVVYWNGFGVGTDEEQRKLLRRI